MKVPGLPQEFEDLAIFLSDWSLPTEPQRYARRLSATLPELRAFYDAIAPRMDAIMHHLAAYPDNDLENLPVETRNLYCLALSYFEASHPIELNWKRTDLDDAFPADRIIYEKPSSEAH